MTDDRIIAAVQRLDPAADLDRDPWSPTARAIHTRATAARRRPPRTRVIGLAAAAALGVGATGAVAAGLFSPDPAALAELDAQDADVAGVHLRGWRGALSTEAVSCVLPDGRTTSTYASDGPRSEPLSVADIVQACTWRVDAVLDADTDPDQAQVCTAELRQDALDERRTTTDDTFLAGSWDDGTPVSPVVLLGGGDCTTQVIAGHLRTTETLSDRDLADINAARALEISFRADGCVDHETALASAEKARAAGGWPIATPTTPAGDGACSSVSFDEWGAIIVEPAPDTGP